MTSPMRDAAAPPQTSASPVRRVIFVIAAVTSLALLFELGPFKENWADDDPPSRSSLGRRAPTTRSGVHDSVKEQEPARFAQPAQAARHSLPAVPAAATADPVGSQNSNQNHD